MRTLLSIVFLLSIVAPANAAVTMVVNQQSGVAIQERAGQLARQLGNELGMAINVVVLPDAAQVEAWLNRYATAELALVEADYAAGRPGQFVTIGPVGRGLALIGRQGIAGDLPQKIAPLLGEEGGRPTPEPPVTTSAVKPQSTRERPAAKAIRSSAGDFSPSKSVSEDRYFVSYVYREKLNRAPSPERLEYWTQQLQSGALTKQQLFEQACLPKTQGCEFQ